jgi:hypothetical protein
MQDEADENIYQLVFSGITDAHVNYVCFRFYLSFPGGCDCGRRGVGVLCLPVCLVRSGCSVLTCTCV